MSGAAGSSQWMYASGGYEIENSLRFDDEANNHSLTRTPSSASNRKTFTFSAWVKIATIDKATRNQIFCAGTSGAANDSILVLNASDNFAYLGDSAGDGSWTLIMKTDALVRDNTSWYHIVYSIDTTQSTASERGRIYINGELATLSEYTAPNQNADLNFNDDIVHTIGNGADVDGDYDGYIAEAHFIDGQRLTAADFGETGDYGEWKPKKYGGSYGTNGFYLEFKQSGTSANSSGLGADTSGNTHHMTVNNLAAHDQMPDTPTNNFCTLTLLNPYGESNLSRIRLKEGALWTYVTDTAHNRSPGTIGVTAGKFYWEELIWSSSQYFWQDQQAAVVALTGFKGGVTNGDANQPGRFENNGAAYHSSGTLYANDNGGQSGWGSSYTKGDIIGIALDMDNGKVWFSKNGTWQASGDPANGSNPAHSGMKTHADTYAALAYLSYGDSTLVFNFGQDSSFAGVKTSQGNQDGNSIGDFYYTPPSGFLALCTKNMSDQGIIPSEHFSNTLYTGNGNNNRAVTGVGFQPDWVWIKGRTTSGESTVHDSLRGPANALFFETESAEDTGGNLVSFDSDGFTTSTSNRANQNNRSLVAWCWKAGGGASSVGSNTDGSINTTDTSVNTDAGFSISTYVGNATSGATVGHGLGVIPEFIMVISRATAGNRFVYHASVVQDNTAAPWTDYLSLETITAATDHAAIWNDTAPTSSVFSLGNNNAVNGNNETFVAYCFHSVAGYSKFGAYKGNAAGDDNYGQIVVTGFRPAWVMIKKTTGAAAWHMFDSARDPRNELKKYLKADDDSVEATSSANATILDFMSNGFKLRGASGDINGNNEQYVYMAFAAVPFKYANAF